MCFLLDFSKRIIRAENHSLIIFVKRNEKEMKKEKLCIEKKNYVYLE